MGHDVAHFSDNFAEVTFCCLGTWTENVARVLIKLLAGVDYYISILIRTGLPEA